MPISRLKIGKICLHFAFSFRLLQELLHKKQKLSCHMSFYHAFTALHHVLEVLALVILPL